MRKPLFTVCATLLVVLFLNASTTAAQEVPDADRGEGKEQESSAPMEMQVLVQVPVFSPLFSDIPLATVNDDTITLNDINSALTSSHGKGKGEKKPAGKIDYRKVLERMINVRLIVQEGTEMGLDELPGLKDLVEEFSRESLRDLLVKDLQKDVTLDKKDEKEVEKLYEESVKEWKIRSVMFRKEEDAKKMEEELKTGGSFDALAAKALEEKLAEGNAEAGYVKPGALQPEIAEAVSKMDVGAVSPILKVDLKKKETGYVLLRLEDIRFPENAEEREKAEEAVLGMKKAEAVKDFMKRWTKEHAKIDTKLVKALDFESPKPGIDNLSKDKRVIVKIKGGKNLTVADLAEAIRQKFFHMLPGAMERRKVNTKKEIVLDGMLQERAFDSEALRRGIDKSAGYLSTVKNYKDSLVFGAFIEKVVVPDIKVSDDDVNAYYAEHVKDFTYPEMMKLDAIAFKNLADAETAAAKLREGADFKWMRANAEGQVPRDAPGFLAFDGATIMSTALPPAVQKALSGARSEDFRLYDSPEHYYYVIYVQDVTPPRERPIGEVRDEVRGRVYNEKLNKAVEEWAGKLRESAAVRIYLARPEGEESTGKAD